MKTGKTLYERHYDICKKLNDTYKQKNAAYGNSFGESYAKFGIISAVTRISDKFNRLATLTTNKDIDRGDESIKDTLLDMANYCIMTYMEIEKFQGMFDEVFSRVFEEEKTHEGFGLTAKEADIFEEVFKEVFGEKVKQEEFEATEEEIDTFREVFGEKVKPFHEMEDLMIEFGEDEEGEPDDVNSPEYKKYLERLHNRINKMEAIRSILRK